MFSCIYQEQKWLYYIILMIINNLDYIYGETDKCESIPQPENTVPINEQPPFDIGKILTFQCRRGYVDSGIRSTAECVNEDGKVAWKITSKCLGVLCDFPGDIDNGYRIGDVFRYPAEVEYKCNPGYRMKGLSKTYCGTSGSWTNPPPTCEIVSCPRPKDPFNGSVTVSSLTYNSEVIYTCNKGFNLSGPVKRQCQENGTWSGHDPECLVVACPEPKKILGGYYVDFKGNQHPKIYVTGDIIVYYCNDTSGQSTVRCQDGIWNEIPPTCAVNPVITVPPTTLIVTPAITVNSTGLSKQVNTEITMPKTTPQTATSAITVKPTGMPGGKGIECHIPKVENGMHVEVTHNTVTYKCESGYKIHGQKTLKCVANDKWDSVAPACVSSSHILFENSGFLKIIGCCFIIFLKQLL